MRVFLFENCALDVRRDRDIQPGDNFVPVRKRRDNWLDSLLVCREQLILPFRFPAERIMESAEIARKLSNPFRCTGRFALDSLQQFRGFL